MTCRLAIFGATGDLTARYLLPGLAALQAAGHLGDDFVVAGASREEWDSGEFQRWAATQHSTLEAVKCWAGPRTSHSP